MATHFHPTAELSLSRFTALIADDQRSSREAISRVMEDDGTIEIVSKCANGNEALAAIEEHSPDMLFVDVLLPEIAGFKVVESSGKKIPAVVFMSALDRYAARAFDAHAADYVVKPFQDERLVQAIERAKMRVMERRRTVAPEQNTAIAAAAPPVSETGRGYLDRLTLREGERTFVQKVQLVDCFTSAANYVYVHCAAQRHRMRATMADLESKLDPRQFIRIHRCSIINIERLKEFRALPHGDYLVTLIDGQELIMSRNYRQRFRHMLSSLAFAQ